MDGWVDGLVGWWVSGWYWIPQIVTCRHDVSGLSYLHNIIILTSYAGILLLLYLCAFGAHIHIYIKKKY